MKCDLQPIQQYVAESKPPVADVRIVSLILM